MSATKTVVYLGSFPAVAFEGGSAARGEPVDVPASLADRLLEQKTWHEYDGPDPDDLESKTVDELKADADAQGIGYPSNVRKAELVRLLSEAAAVEAVAEGEES